MLKRYEVNNNFTGFFTTNVNLTKFWNELMLVYNKEINKIK